MLTNNFLLGNIKTTRSWEVLILNEATRRDILVGYRKQRGWLQKDVVEKLAYEYKVSISESYYGMIEQGVRTPSLNVALAISALFDAEPTDFFLNSNTTFCCEYVKAKQLA